MNTLTVQMEQESLTESLTAKQNKQQNQNRVLKPNLSYTDILHHFLF